MFVWRFCVVILAGLAAGCVSKPTEGMLAPVQAAPQGGKRVDVLVASSRRRGDNPYSFGFGRSTVVNYQLVGLSIPPGHRRGQIEQPKNRPPDPATEFAALANVPLTGSEFDRRIAENASRGAGNANVFIHGFNTTYEDAVFRAGQIVGDSNLPGASVLFTWPSRGRVTDYLTDRESATFSRDQLEQVLLRLAAQPSVKRINLLAHSMGAFLMMETLRQARHKGNGEFSGKLNSVGLAAPDIDLDVFRSQLAAIGRRSRPTLILVSTDDRALSWSRFLSGDVERVGVAKVNSREANEDIKRFGLILIDASAVKSTDEYNHDKFANVPSMIQQIAGLAPGQAEPAAAGIVTLDAEGRLLDRAVGNN